MKICGRLAVRSISLLLALSLNGCIVPIISGFRQMGLTANSREELLQNDLQVFHAGMQRNEMQTVLNYIGDDADAGLRDQVRDELRSAKRKEKMVEAGIDFVDYSDESRRATVEMRIKYYKIPYYVIKERLETEEWAWHTSDGWKLASREVKDVAADE